MIREIIAKAVFYLFVTVWTLYAVFRMLLEIARERGKFFAKKDRSFPPAVLTDDWEHGTITLSEVKLHYVCVGDEGRPLMLLVHGFPEFWYSWRHQINEFKKEYRVVAIDMRGYGDSDKPKGIENYTVPKLINDIAELIPAMGYKSCVLVAHDWGGAVAWRVALEHPELVDSLIVCNCPHTKAFQKLLRGGSLKQMGKSWYMFFFQTPCLPEVFLKAADFKALETILTDPSQGGCRNKGAITHQDIEAWKYTYSQPGALTSPLNYYRAAFQLPANTHRENWTVQPRVLLIWGTEDVALETALADLSMEWCRDGRVALVPGASHWVQQDEPRRVNELMRAFLEE